MTSLIIVSLSLIIAIPIALILLLRGSRKPPKCAYQKTAMLFSPEERMFHAVLEHAVGKEFAILGKIRVGQIIQPKRESNQGSVGGGYRQLAARCFPFVLCNHRDLSVVCAVQLRDRKYASRKHAEADGLLHELCDAVGLPLVTIETNPNYEAGEVRDMIMEALHQQPLSLPNLDGRKEPRISSIDGLDLG